MVCRAIDRKCPKKEEEEERRKKKKEEEEQCAVIEVLPEPKNNQFCITI